MYAVRKIILISAVNCIILSLITQLTYQRDPNQEEAKELAAIKQCGTSNDLAHRVEICAKPLLDLIQGTADFWPKNINEVKNLCEQFHGSERCIRANARKCSKGLQKTIVSSVATSIQRSRKYECQDDKYNMLIKTSKCFEAHKDSVHRVVSNMTSHLEVVERDMKDMDKRVNAVCCLVVDLEKILPAAMHGFCPEESKIVNRIIKTVLDDALEIVCRNPKCNNVFQGYKVDLKYKEKFGGMIESMLRVIFAMTE